jgi:hypothetical protein
MIRPVMISKWAVVMLDQGGATLDPVAAFM